MCIHGVDIIAPRNYASRANTRQIAPPDLTKYESHITRVTSKNQRVVSRGIFDAYAMQTEIKMEIAFRLDIGESVVIVKVLRKLRRDESRTGERKVEKR